MTIRVFLSSTFTDMQDERSAVIDSFRRLRVKHHLDVDLITMEDFGFVHRSAKDESLRQLRSCHAYLGLLSNRYGSIHPKETYSFTHLEYLEARDLGLPIFLLEKSDGIRKTDIETDPKKLELLNEWHSDAKLHQIVLPFSTSSDIRALLAEHMRDHFEELFPVSCYIDEKTKQDRVKFFQMDDLAKNLFGIKRTPGTIDVAAITGGSWLRSQKREIERQLREGTRLRILTLKHAGDAIDLIKHKFDKDLNKGIETTRTVISELTAWVESGRFAGSIHHREIDWLFSAALLIIDRNTSGAIGWVGTYTPDFATPTEQKWFIELTSTSGNNALEFYSDQFDRLWERGLDQRLTPNNPLLPQILASS